MGLTAADVQDIAANWLLTMHAVLARIVAMKGYAWQLLQWPEGSNRPTAPRPAAFFRQQCAPNSTSATSPIAMLFTAAATGEGAGEGGQPSAAAPAPALPWFEQDLAAFLLVRSEYAWLGYEGDIDDSSTSFLVC